MKHEKPLAPVEAETFAKVAVHVTELPAILTVPLSQPLPDQPEKVEPSPGCAVSATEVPSGKRIWHAVPQAMPVGIEITLPMPLPAKRMLRAPELPISVIVFAPASLTYACVPSGLMATPASADIAVATALTVTGGL